MQLTHSKVETGRTNNLINLNLVHTKKCKKQYLKDTKLVNIIERN